jgi:predicted RNA-binding Zn-ribbon protein involved in translation (DUF1610 family)
MPPKRPKVPCPEQAFTPKSTRKACTSCGTNFGMTTWRYNCHMCGDVVCDNCSQRRLTLPPVYTSEPVRVCDPCLPNATQLGGKAPNNGNVLGTRSESTENAGREETPEERRAKLVAARMGSAGASKSAAKPTARSNVVRSSQPQVATATEQPVPATTAADSNDVPAVSPTSAPPPPEPADPVVNPATTSTPSDPAVVTANADVKSPTSPTGAAATGAASDERPMNPVLAAAMKRKADAEAKNGRPQSATVDPQRLVLLQQVRERLKSKGVDEPFGLSSYDRTKLQMYLQHLNSA